MRKPSAKNPDNVFSAEPEQPKRANRVAGELELSDGMGHTFVLRPTYPAAIEIEDALGSGIDGLWSKIAGSGIPGMPSITQREIGVIMAAGIRAAGEERATAEKCAEIAWKIGRKDVLKVMVEFMYALVHGGKLRDDDLKKSASSNGSSASDATEEQTAEILKDLESRIGAT